MAITTKGRSDELEEKKKKIIKFNPMGKTAQKEAAKKNKLADEENNKSLTDKLGKGITNIFK